MYKHIQSYGVALSYHVVLCFFVAVYIYIFQRGTTVSEDQGGGGVKINWRDQ